MTRDRQRKLRELVEAEDPLAILLKLLLKYSHDDYIKKLNQQTALKELLNSLRPEVESRRLAQNISSQNLEDYIDSVE